MSKRLRRGSVKCIASASCMYIVYSGSKNKGKFVYFSLQRLMFTDIHIDDKWCTLQRFMDENHVHVCDENLITSSSAWPMKVVHIMLVILFPASITMWGTSPLDHEGNDQSAPFLPFPTWTICVVNCGSPFHTGNHPTFPCGEGLQGSFCW